MISMKDKLNDPLAVQLQFAFIGLASRIAKRGGPFPGEAEALKLK